MQKVAPCLWFDHQAEEAAQFYTSVFKNGSIGTVLRYEEGTPGEPESVMSVTFFIEGQEFIALNGGPVFTFTPAISLFVKCADQREIDELWDKLTSDGGAPSRCGWLTDKYGVSWQIVPTQLGEMLQDPEASKRQRVMSALLQMEKLDLTALRAAYEAQ